MSKTHKKAHRSHSAISGLTSRATAQPLGHRTKYGYDNIGQLVLADSSLNSEDRGYRYDHAWNLNWRTNNGTAYHFLVDTKNELTNAFSATYSYDANGNLISGTNSHNSYVYDDENRLIQWFYYATPGNCTNGALRTDFFYDGIGRLRKRVEYSITASGGGSLAPIQLTGSGGGCPWVLQSETHYIYDGNLVIQERDGNNNPLVSYTRGPDLSGTMQGAGGIGGLLARSSGYSGGNWTSHAYYHEDANGNITYLETSSQGLGASYRYDPFGNTISSSGTLATNNVYRFSSKEYMTNSATYYYLQRFYNPNFQRWIHRDPQEEKGGINLYSFAFNDPINRFDPDGRGVLSGILRGLGGSVLGTFNPPCANVGTTPEQCNLLLGGPVTFGSGPGAAQTCTYQCTGPHPSDEPNSAPPPTISVIVIPPGYSCPADPHSAPIPPFPTGTPVMGPATPNPQPYPRPNPGGPNLNAP